MNAQPVESASSAKQWEYYTDMPVGEILRRARSHYGQSLDEVAGYLRIRASQLGALEDGRLDQLPGRVYAIGFVRAYSEYLGLDGEKMVQLFKIQSVGTKKQKPELSFPVSASESKLPGIYILGASFAALVLLITVLVMMGNVEEPVKSTGVPPVPETVKAEATAPVSDPSAQAAATTPAEAPPRVVVNIKESSWVEIRNSSGQAVISQVLKSGDQYIVPNEEKGMVLATGNIGGLEFVVDGKAIPALGAKGDVRRGVQLEPEILSPGTKPVVVPAPAAAPAATETTPEEGAAATPPATGAAPAPVLTAPEAAATAAVAGAVATSAAITPAAATTPAAAPAATTQEAAAPVPQATPTRQPTPQTQAAPKQKQKLPPQPAPSINTRSRDNLDEAYVPPKPIPARRSTTFY